MQESHLSKHYYKTFVLKQVMLIPFITPCNVGKEREIRFQNVPGESHIYRAGVYSLTFTVFIGSDQTYKNRLIYSYT